MSINATFCAALVDQWVTEGLRFAFVAPGSRSTPLALALAADDRVRLEVLHDERSAAFAALGSGLATGIPAVVACTSGTAGTHFHAAVVEADLSAVPLLVCTADRPPELWGRGAPQTIRQSNLFGEAVRAFEEPGPPDDVDPAQWRLLASRAWQSATGATPGPVQLNLSFREPLVGEPDALPAAVGASTREKGDGADPHAVAELAERLAGRRGVIVAGRNESEPGRILELAARLAWPVLGDHRSGTRAADTREVIGRYDALLRHGPTAQALRPEVVLRLGEIVSSKSTSQWLAAAGAAGADIISSRPHGRLIDPEAVATTTIDERGLVDALLDALPDSPATPGDWLDRWRELDDLADSAIAEVLAEHPGSEPAVARAVLRAVPTGGTLVVASSMPVRDVEWYGGSRNDVQVLSNRGANGIDGTIATAIGAALDGRPVWCLVGDVAFLHDSTSLIGLGTRRIDLTVVIVDNDGGGIFSFLPQRTLLEPDRYELLFGTPHGVDLAALVRAHGLTITHWPELASAGGVRFARASSERDANLRVHDRLNAAVAAAVDPE